MEDFFNIKLRQNINNLDKVQIPNEIRSIVNAFNYEM